MHNFVYLAKRRSQEFSCEPNFGGGVCRPPGPPGCTTWPQLSRGPRQLSAARLRVAERGEPSLLCHYVVSG